MEGHRDGKKALPDLNKCEDEGNALPDLNKCEEDEGNALPDLNKCEDEGNERDWEQEEGRWPRINNTTAHIDDRECSTHWKSLLNMPSMHVLVVEKNEATRCTVVLLLRQCGYQVGVAADGLEAWKVLTDPSNNIDLVLSEIDTPDLSGIALLSKIIGHNTLKHIPVVMMSLNDSTGLIFNCLSKGAVDFLMKPLRRNELKNLWQHVWRRYHCPYGSWSEVGKQVQKSVKSKGNEDFDDTNTCSSEEDDSWSFGSRGGCAYGSDNQDNGSILRHLGLSSFTRYNTPSNSNESHCGNMGSDFPCDKSSEVVKDSLVNFLSTSNARSPNPCSDGVADSFSIAAMGKDLKIGISRHLDLQLDHPVEVPIALVGSKQNIFSEIESNNFSEPRDKGKGDSSSTNLKERTANQMCVIPNTAVAYMDSREFEDPSGPFKISEISTEAVSDAKEPTSIDFTFKRLRKSC